MIVGHYLPIFKITHESLKSIVGKLFAARAHINWKFISLVHTAQGHIHGIQKDDSKLHSKNTHHDPFACIFPYQMEMGGGKSEENESTKIIIYEMKMNTKKGSSRAINRNMNGNNTRTIMYINRKKKNIY
jgi:hypothetical protein